MAKPAKGKRFAKIIKTVGGRTRKVSYGQAGKASDGKDRIRPGTSKASAYCARSWGIKGDWKKDRNSPNSLSRRKWGCVGPRAKK